MTDDHHGPCAKCLKMPAWMIGDGLWEPKSRREIREHPSRGQRECLGDLVQIDGSPHDWFEGRGPSCTLIVYVDDATSRLLAAGFFAAETTEAYMRTTARTSPRTGGRWRTTRTATGCSG